MSSPQEDTSPGQRGSVDRPRPARWIIRALTMLALLLSLPLVLLLVGTFFPSIPGLGAIGSMVLPTVAPQAVLAAVIAVLMAVVAVVLRRGKVTAAVAVLSLLAVAGTGTIFGSQLRLALDAGVSVSASMWSLDPVSAGAPDRSVSYPTDDSGTELRMDVYEPGDSGEAPEAGAPVLVYMHGGGWVSGTPAETAATLRWFADQGYLVLSPEYTLATPDQASWDVAMPQVACSLVWTGQQASELGGDPSRIAVLGGSAGGNLALTSTYAAADGQLDLPCEGEVPSIKAVAGLVPAVDPEAVYNNPDPVMGGYDRQLVQDFLGGVPKDHPDRVQAVQAETYLSPDAPPTLIIGHRSDHIVPIASIRDFVDAARDAEVDVTYEEIIWADHTTPLLNNGPTSQAARHQLRGFIRAYGV